MRHVTSSINEPLQFKMKNLMGQPHLNVKFEAIILYI